MSSEMTISAGGPFAGTVIDVTDHGAAGDDSKDDTEALRAVIDGSREGDAIYFPAGTYLVSKRLVPKPRQVYFSLTDAAIIKVKPAPERKPFSVFEVIGGPVEFRHLSLDLTESQQPEKERTAPPGILAQAGAAGTVDLMVSSCRIGGGYGQGIRVTGSGDETRRDRVIVRDSLVEGCYESGLTLNKVNGARVEASRFDHCRNGIQVALSRDVVVHAVTATENRRHGIAARFSHNWHVDNCLAKCNGGKETDQDKLRGFGIAAGGGPDDPAPTPNSDFTITNNISVENYNGGITLDPTLAADPKEVVEQRARVSGNVCQGRRDGMDLAGDNTFGTHGIHVRNSSEVVLTDNLCHQNNNSGIQLVNCSHVLVQANVCFANLNGIGLFSRDDLKDPAGRAGGLVIGVNMLYRNTHDLKQGDFGESPQAFPGLRLYGLHGKDKPECNLRANPGTIFEWHDDRDREGALFVKEHGYGSEGWVEVATKPEEERRPPARNPSRLQASP